MLVQATTGWGIQLHANTGGAAKTPKSFQYLTSYKLKIRALKVLDVNPTIGRCLGVISLGANHAITKKTLGVWGNPLNKPTVP